MPFAKWGILGSLDAIREIAQLQTTVRPRDMRRNGISHAWLRFHCQWGDLDEVAPAVFVKHGVSLHPVALHAARFPRHVATATTALWLHGITERPRDQWWLTKLKAKRPLSCRAPNRMLRSRWVEEGVEDVEIQRVPLRIHSPLWAALHCVRFRGELGTTTARDAVERTLASGRVSREELFETAKRCHLRGPLERLLRPAKRPLVEPETDAGCTGDVWRPRRRLEYAAGVSDDFQGTTRYRVLKRLGAGGMGVVYEALDLERGSQRVAVKLLRQQDPASLMRLKREFRSLADVAHPHLVQLYDLVSEGGTWFFTLEHVEGVDFLSWVRKQVEIDRDAPTGQVDQTVRREGNVTGAVDLVRLRAALKQLVSGVAALHAAGRLHRDLKPSNVLVRPDGTVKILDFGLVTELAGHESIGESQGQTLVGTAAYMAPEQAVSSHVGPPADWYAVGVMLYQALTGALPFEGGSMQVLLDKQTLPAPPPRDRNSGVPDDLDRLAVALLQKEPAARPTTESLLALTGAAELPAAPAAAPADTSFVGRERELETLRAELTASRQQARLVELFGSSGIGKSALARHFLEVAQANGAMVLSGRCYERESVPFKALDTVIDTLARRLATTPPDKVDAILPRDASVLARMFPVLKRVDAFAKAPVRDVQEASEQRRRAAGALRELLARMADRSAVIVFIDDVQWGDDDSRAILDEMVHPPDAPAVLWMLASREPRADARELPIPTTKIVIEALSPTDTRALAKQAVGEGGAERVDRLAQECGGNPFLLQQLAAHAGGADAGLDGVVRARLGALEAASRTVLEVVAVAGRPIDERVAAKAAQLPASEWSRVLALKSAHLLKASPGEGADRLEAWHDRIRENVVGGLTVQAQAVIHGRLAAALAELQPNALDALAFHLQASGQIERATEAIAAAALRAAQALAFERAAELYRRALEQLPATDERRRALTTQLGDALADAGRGVEAASAYARALNEPGQGADALELKRRAAEQLLRSGHIDEGLQAINDVLSQVGMTLAKSPWRALGALMFRRAHLALRGTDFRERTAAEVGPQLLQQVDVCWSVSVGLAMVDTIRGASFQTRQLLLALDSGEPYRVARALAAEGAFVATAGAPAEARATQLIAQARTLAERVGDGRLSGLVEFCAALTHFLVGRYAAAVEHSEQAERSFKDLGSPVTWEAATARLFSVWSLFYLGELADLSKRVPLLLREAQGRGDRYALTSLQTGLSNVSVLAAGDPTRARAQVREAMAQWSQSSFHFQHYWAVLSEGMIDLYEGKPQDALKRTRDAWPKLKSSMLLRIQNVRIEATFLRARSALASGELGEALADAERLEAENVDWARGFAAVIRGLCGRPESLQQAIQVFEASDMRLFAAATRLRLGEISQGPLAQASLKAGEAWLLAQGVKDPAALARMLVPPALQRG
jgi:serine/threonine protein kinase/tetratricopeptide (TPR) repeat protein